MFSENKHIIWILFLIIDKSTIICNIYTKIFQSIFLVLMNIELVCILKIKLQK